MSKDFIKRKMNGDCIDRARQQQDQINYFTQSRIHKDLSLEYLKQWADRNYSSNDYFLNWVKSVFKTDNFLSFYKYCRFPISSAGLVQNEIKPALERVFHAVDSFEKYTLRGKPIPCPLELEEGTEDLFEALLFQYNDIVVTDMESMNTPKRIIVPIDCVVSIESENSIIKRIAYAGMVNGERGHVYIDAEMYAFYPEDDGSPILTQPHDLGRCPADYISAEPFDKKESDVVRKSIFTYSRTDMEEFVFLKTIQKMSEPNGLIPIVTKIQTREENGNVNAPGTDKQPMESGLITGQKSEIQPEYSSNSGGVLQAGTIIEVPPLLKDGGGIDMDFVKNYLNFFYIPVECLEFINERIKETRSNIISTILGDYTEANESAKNEMQVGKSFVSKEDRIRALSKQLSRIKTRSDFNWMALKYGPGSVTVEYFSGSQFFFETQADIYDMLIKSPNPIESKSLLIRLARVKNKFNKDNAEREKILYLLLPYATQKDFETAVLAQNVGPITFQYQTRFNYWIEMFEAMYGDILYFWNSNDAPDSQKLVLINELIIDLIKANYEQPVIEKNSASEVV